MTWVATLVRCSESAAVSDLPTDWKPPVIGTLDEVTAVFEETFPGQHHVPGQTKVKGEGFWITFSYVGQSLTPDAILAIGVESNAGIGAPVALKLICDRLNCRLLDHQTGEFADFAEQTKDSMEDFTKWRRRAARRTVWILSAATVVVTLVHLLQDFGAIPKVEAFSKLSVGSYGFVGLLAMNLLLFLSGVLSAMKQLSTAETEDTSQEEKELIEEAILLPAFQGERDPPQVISRFVHIPITLLVGLIAGSILAWLLSVALL